MPLPTTDMTWPPTDPCVQEALGDWDAWYSSDPDRLAERYINRGTRGVQNRPSQLRGGMVGRFARWWWGQPTAAGEKRSKLHVPLAGDIARTSSDLLFSEPPNLRSEHAATQQRLDELVESGLHPTLLEGGEVCAALGGTLLRVSWDTAIADRPWITAVAADCTVPDFSYGKLRAVTVWRVVHEDGQDVWRHLERHEPGVILHGLYEGTTTRLGKPVSLEAMEATQGLQPTVPTGADRMLTAAYVPNVRPARSWRHIPSAAGLGQSDFQGIEGTMDALDETYSSWMRDIRNGKGRVVVPQSMLTSNGPGQGASWDQEREIWTGLNIMQRPGDTASLDVIQFTIRVEEHRDTCRELTELAVRQAGYSGASFGLSGDGSAVTATEIRARERRSMTTRARKALYWGPAIADIVAALLAVEAGPLFGVQGLEVDLPDVEFQDSISDSPGELAETASLLRQAEAASTETLVEMLHPDWDADQVAAEVARIQGETGRSVADPAALGAGGAGLFEGAPAPPADQQGG